MTSTQTEIYKSIKTRFGDDVYVQVPIDRVVELKITTITPNANISIGAPDNHEVRADNFESDNEPVSCRINLPGAMARLLQLGARFWIVFAEEN